MIGADRVGRMGVAAMSLLGTAATVDAQVSSQSGLDVGVSVGLFADYPTHFAGQSCEQNAGGLAARVGRGITALLSLEASAVATFGAGEVRCAFPAAPATPDGGFFNRVAFSDDIEGQSFVATTVAAVFRPLSTAVMSPRLIVGGGRLLGQGAVDMDVRRWCPNTVRSECDHRRHRAVEPWATT